MDAGQLHNFNLNLLVVFVILMRERSGRSRPALADH
jgi:hypothetical protein